MAKYRVTGPDGEYEVTAPDDATDEQVIGFAKQNFGRRAADRKDMERMADPTTGAGVIENAAAGAGKFITDMGRGAQQIGASVGIGDKAAIDAEVADSRKRDAALMKTTSGKVGYFAPALATAMIPGANTVAGGAVTGATLGALQPTGEGESRIANTVVGGVFGTAGSAIGQEGGAAVRTLLAKRAAERVAAQSTNAASDATLAAGREAGYVVPPAQANPTVLNKVLEGTAGKISTAQAASAKNQEVTNRLTALGLSLPHNERITPQALVAIRKDAGKAYEKIAEDTFVADATFKTRIEGLAAAQRQLAEEMPELAKGDILKLVNGSLTKDSFSGRTLVEAMKSLRDKATVAYRAGESEEGRFYQGAARELEDLIERNIVYTGGGGPNALKELREARKLIAKSHAAEAALNPATGNIDAAVFARALKKGKPLSDEMKLVAEYAQAYPKATQLPERIGSQPGISPLDVGFAAAKGDAGGLAWLTGRPAVRSLILSKFFQNAAAKPSYEAPIAERATLEAIKGNRLTAALRAAMPAGYVSAKN